VIAAKFIDSMDVDRMRASSRGMVHQCRSVVSHVLAFPIPARL
jgi:hypothetical protein